MPLVNHSTVCRDRHCPSSVLISCEGKRKKQHLLGRPVTEMDSKHQCVKLNDGHLVPVLEFGTGAPLEVIIIFLVLSVQRSKARIGGS